jgi:hypothetical protein
MLDKLKYEDYVGEVNSKFKLAETSVEIELIEITERRMTTQQERFSLIFLGAKDDFLAEGYKYEAGFNRIIG